MCDAYSSGDSPDCCVTVDGAFGVLFAKTCVKHYLVRVVGAVPALPEHTKGDVTAVLPDARFPAAIVTVDADAVDDITSFEPPVPKWFPVKHIDG